MTNRWKLACSATALMALGLWTSPDTALSQAAPKKSAPGVQSAGNQGIISDNTVLRIPANAQFPVNRQINLGNGRSMMVQFPMELRDVMVSDPNKVDVILQSSDRVFLVAKSPGSANTFFFDSQGNQIATLEINIGSDLSSLDNLLRRLLPGSNVKSELAGASIVLTGSVRSPSDANKAMQIAEQYAEANKGAIGASSATSTRSEVGGVVTWQTTSQSNTANKYKHVINMLQVEGDDQVMLKVTVAEVNRSILKQFGVNISSSIQAGNFSQGFSTANSLPITSTTLGGLGGTGFDQTKSVGQNCSIVQSALSGTTVGNSGLLGGYSLPNFCFAHSIRALERHGLVRTLAEPTLTAVSGETAKFLAGGEYPIPVSYVSGTLGLEFKEYGVALAFTPVVQSEGRISLKVDTQVSELSNDGALVLSGTQIPSLRKRSALSTIELPSGGSMTLAGLISDQTRQNIDGFPGLKDVPILGSLFSSKDFQKSETELVIIVTPYMVRPTARQNLANPTDGLAPASDLKTNILGHLNRVYGKGKPLPEGDLKGSHGFIVD